MVLTAGEDGTARWEANAAAGDEVRQFVEAVRSGLHKTQREVAAALGWDTSKVTRVKARAIGEHRISKDEVTEALAASRAAAGGSAEF